MGGLFVGVSLLLTLIFMLAPIALSVSIVNRYNQVERTIGYATALLRALIAYSERGQRPEATSDQAPPPVAPAPSRLYTIIRALFRRPVIEPGWLTRFNIADDFQDYLDVLREGRSDAERYMRFKRKNLKLQQAIVRDVEFCRTYTETLPYMGILGTVLGFFFSPAVLAPGVTAGGGTVTVGGLVLALLSTAVALICLIFIKLVYENRVIPQYIEFENSLQTLNDYANRYNPLRTDSAAS
jgi:biopolymer transport protein ExbB/TolQ